MPNYFDGSTLTKMKEFSTFTSELSTVLSNVETGKENPIALGTDFAATLTKNADGTFKYELDKGASVAYLTRSMVGDANANQAWEINGTKSSKDQMYRLAGMQVNLTSGAGSDRIDVSGTKNGSYVNAAEGDNVVALTGYVENAADRINGYAAEDGSWVDATTNAVSLQNATVIAGNGADFIYGIANSTVDAGAGNNTLVSANATALGNTGSVLITGSGNDSIVAAGGDTITTGKGIDTIDLVNNLAANGDANFGRDLAAADRIVVLNDYSFDEGDIIGVNDAAGVGAMLDVSNEAAYTQTAANFVMNGHVIDYAQAAANGEVTLNNELASNYQVIIADANDPNGEKHHVYFGGSAGSTMSAEGHVYNAYMIGNNNGDARDYIIGGERNDTIIAGEDDTIDGKGWDDSIYIDQAASSVHVMFNTSSGKDSVYNFSGGSGEDADVVRVDEGLDNVSAAVSGNDIVLGIGSSASLTLIGNANKNYWTGVDDLYNIQMTDTDGSTVSAAVVAANDNGTITNDVSGVGYYYGSNSTLTASGVTSKVVIDLGNTGNYGTSEKYKGIVAVVGTNANENVLIGADGVNNTLYGGKGGANTLYGGGAGNNVLVGEAKSADTFGFGASSGNDVAKKFVVTEDRVYAADGVAATSAYRDAKNIILGFDNGGTLTLENTANNKVDTATAITYTADGVTNKEMLLGLSDQANTFNYSSEVDYFYGSATQTDTLKVTGGGDNKIYFDSRTGQDYTYVDVLDASASTGNNELGGGSAADSIMGGQGTDSLWGGIYGNDTLKGGTGRNIFYYGANEGNDVITAFNDGDKVMLYNVAENQVAAGQLSGSDMVITLKDNSTLTVKGYAEGGSMSFELADATYTYDKSSGAWNKA